MTIDYVRYYDVETYLFSDVHRRFHARGYLTAFDFFTIVIWKANRAKSKVAARLLAQAPDEETDLDVIVRSLTRSLFDAETERERLRILLKDWGFLLPMAAAVLSVLWPKTFPMYDIRVCDQLGKYHKVANISRFERIWAGYQEYRDAVIAACPPGLSLRDADRYLWGKSSAMQLEKDIAQCFGKDKTKTKQPRDDGM